MNTIAHHIVPALKYCCVAEQVSAIQDAALNDVTDAQYQSVFQPDW